MNIAQKRELHHPVLKIAALLLPMLFIAGCESASSGHAPGVAGGESLTPGTTNFPLAYVKRPQPATQVKDIMVEDLITSITGSDLYIRSQANSSGTEVNVTGSITNGMGAVRDLDVSPDGTKVVFSLRLPLTKGLKNDDPKNPNWHIYQYDAVTKTVTQLTNDGIIAGHDVGAHYLPDGRIVFASTRQTATLAIELNEGRPQYPAQTEDRQQSIFALHVMNADGTSVHQITFNTNHDFNPSVLDNGQILFSRWEVINGVSQISLYRVNPDGTGLELYYGANSHMTGPSVLPATNVFVQFLNARQRTDGKTLAIVRPDQGTQLGGDIQVIDGGNFVEQCQPSAPLPPNCAGQATATTLGVTTDENLPSLGGRFSSFYPLYDGTSRMIVSWSPCLVQDTSTTPAKVSVCTASNTAGLTTAVVKGAPTPTVSLAPPEYTLWLWDFGAGTLSPVLSGDVGTDIVEPVILQARTPAPTPIPDFAPTTPTQQALAAAGVGVLNISSIYDFDGEDTATPSISTTADPSQAGYYTRPYRFVRVSKAVEIPSKTVRKIDNTAFGPAGMGMREILGYAPVQPDGSVQVQVPANVPFTIDILDANARRVLTRHTSWMQVMPGEVKSCNGCHTTPNPSRPSHGRNGLTTAVNPGALLAGQPFPHANPAITAVNVGDTMAATLVASTCGNTSKSLTSPTCAQVPSSDVVYTNIWSTNGTTLAGQTDASFSYTYAGAAGLSELPPTNANCVPWSAQCRAVIHYASAQSPTQLYIQGLWNLTTRPMVNINGVPTAPTCVLCHNTVSAANAIQVPAGQLDLTGGVSSVVTTVVTSYEDILSSFTHNAQVLQNGILVDETVPGVGPVNPATGQPTTIQVPVTVNGPMAAGSANGSTAFFAMFDGTDAAQNGAQPGYVDHTNYLTPAELRLVSEWLDIGGQFYNDPFVAPVAN